MSSADAPGTASRSGDRSDADCHGADQLSPAGSTAGQTRALTSRQPDDAEKHDEASSAGQVVEPEPRPCRIRNGKTETL